MTPEEQLAKRIWHTFAQSTGKLREEFLDNVKNHPDRLALQTGELPIIHFSDFNTEHGKRSETILKQFKSVGSGQLQEIDALTKVLDLFDNLKVRENPDLLYFALQTFLIHYKGQIKFIIPSVLVTDSDIIAPARATTSVTGLAIAVGSSDETKLDWFREAPSINEHHQHWHAVYNRRMVFDRQGEMFFFMHQQMLARYDAERIAESVARVIAFDDLNKNISVGYAPGPDERLSHVIERSRNPQEKVALQSAQHQNALIASIRADIDGGHYDPAGTSMKQETDAVNKLGSTIESNANPQADSASPYNNYHGFGHGWIAAINNGVMNYLGIAVRDVIFWEWHKGIDDIYFRLQERMQPYDFNQQQPKVKLRKGVDNETKPYTQDIIFCETAKIPGADQNDFDGDAFGNSAFGGTQWDKDFEEGSFNFTDAAGQNKKIETTKSLRTSMATGTIHDQRNGVSYNYEYLMHEPFSYFVRIENTALQAQQITIRVFIVPIANAPDRRSWIEMDKFLYELRPTSKNVIFRQDVQSSVIRKKAVKNPDTEYTQFNPEDVPDGDRTCDCGWPYHLLVPKGQESGNGMPFRIMVMITDAGIDMIEQEKNCGSLSFCAARTTDYPDKRPLGYPFNRKFSASIADTINAMNNMACRTLLIKHQ